MSIGQYYIKTINKYEKLYNHMTKDVEKLPIRDTPKNSLRVLFPDG